MTRAVYLGGDNRLWSTVTLRRIGYSFVTVIIAYRIDLVFDDQEDSVTRSVHQDRPLHRYQHRWSSLQGNTHGQAVYRSATNEEDLTVTTLSSSSIPHTTGS